MTKCQKKTSWGKGHIHYLDCGGDFKGVSMYKKDQIIQFKYVHISVHP